jgi:acetyl esterase/lipase
LGFKGFTSDPILSPIRFDLSAFPPTLLISGTRDHTLSNTAMLHRALSRANTNAELHIFEGMPHGHWLFPQIPEAKEVHELMARFFDTQLP